MSVRVFKRLFGETSLERKCRFMLGGGILLLTSLSFWLYAWQTEQIAVNQIIASGRLLVSPFLAELHLPKQEDKAVKDFNKSWEENWITGSEVNYHQDVLKLNAKDPKNKPGGDEVELMERFRDDPTKREEVRWNRDRDKIYYYAPIRAGNSCLACHPISNSERADTSDSLKENELMAVFRFDFNTDSMRSDIHTNRAWLITNALVSAILIMVGSYIVIRQVIVKPVKHLKEVTNAVADGKLNVRSEIHTNDEFEDLSYAFNRMLINLVSMQDRLKALNTELDGKVDELARANMALFESNRVKGDFLATVSHELRTPLNNILGFSDLLLGSAQIAGSQRRWIENIDAGGRQLLSLINDLLDLAKIEAGKMQVRGENFGLAEVCEGVVTGLRPMAEKKNIEFRQQIAPDIPPLYQDAGKLRQILSNLLSNALKFTPEGGRVLLQARREEEMIVIDVIDNGVGIAPEDREAIFEKFRQTANPMTRRHEGSGLGLSIVRELSKLLGGDVSLQSELGRGSTFTVRLPIRLAVENAGEAAY
jgi:signal transduction histidine kinase